MYILYISAFQFKEFVFFFLCPSLHFYYFYFLNLTCSIQIYDDSASGSRSLSCAVIDRRTKDSVWMTSVIVQQSPTMRQNMMNRRNRNNATRCAGVLDDHMDVHLRVVTSKEGLDETATRHSVPWHCVTTSWSDFWLRVKNLMQISRTKVR